MKFKIVVHTNFGTFTSMEEEVTQEELDSVNAVLDNMGSLKNFTIVPEEGRQYYFGPELLKNSVVEVITQ